MSGNGHGRHKDCRAWISKIGALPGVEILRDQAGHYRIHYQGSYVTTVSKTGGYGRGLENARAKFRRATGIKT